MIFIQTGGRFLRSKELRVDSVKSVRKLSKDRNYLENSLRQEAYRKQVERIGKELEHESRHE